MQTKRKLGSVDLAPEGVGSVKRLVKRVRFKSSLALAQCVFLALFASSCKPFNVKPRIQVPRAANESQAETSGLVVHASVVRDEDWLNDTFDANLILAGIVPVRVELKNTGQIPVELSKARFELKTASGGSLESASGARAFKRALGYYDVSAWSKALYKESKADFASYTLDVKTPLAMGESRQGLLYFLLPGDTAGENGVTLVVSRLKSSDQKGGSRVELKLN